MEKNVKIKTVSDLLGLMSAEFVANHAVILVRDSDGNTRPIRSFICSYEYSDDVKLEVILEI